MILRSASEWKGEREHVCSDDECRRKSEVNERTSKARANKIKFHAAQTWNMVSVLLEAILYLFALHKYRSFAL